MEEIVHKQLKVNGINMHVAELGDGPAVLLLHGFPELWYSWRHQKVSLSARDYRTIAPDLRGYGDTEAPPAITSYTGLHIVGDQVALLDALVLDQKPGEAEAAFARFDTATVIASFMSIREPKPERCLCVPVNKPLDVLFKTPPTLPEWLTPDDLDYFVSKFNKTGFTGGLNYYRNFDLTWELTAPWTNLQVKVPVKFVIGELDLTNNFTGVKEFITNGGFKKHVPLLEEIVVLKGVGHFLNQEKLDLLS